MSPEYFNIAIDQAVLDDLNQRLRRTRWPQDMPGDGWEYGTNVSYLRELVDYWVNDYDWRHWEERINRFNHYKVLLDDIPVHFIRQPGKGPDPIPLILSHGWPWTFWDLHQVIEPLSDPAAHGGDPADAFEVIVPSLPGFGFSTPLTTPGINFWRTADLWRKLMVEVLGFERFAAQGGDWGALITSQLAHKYAQDLVGIHVSAPMRLDLMQGDRPWDLAGSFVNQLEGEQREAVVAVERRLASHVTTHILDPQTLAYGATDSPVALLAWLLERRRAWSDCGGDVESRFSKDELITNAMLYWVTESFATSVRYYAETARYPWKPSHQRSPLFEAPAGISIFHNDGAGLYSTGLLDLYQVHFLREHHSGGHFAPAEEPAAIIEDIRSTFRTLR